MRLLNTYFLKLDALQINFWAVTASFSLAKKKYQRNTTETNILHATEIYKTLLLKGKRHICKPLKSLLS